MSRNIRLLYVHNFLTDFRLQAPYLVIYFAQILHSYTLAMALMAAEQVSSALFDVPTGIMSDHIGRRKTLALGSLTAAIGIGCYALSSGFAGLLVGAILCGLSSCLFNGNNNALLYETLKSENMQTEYHHYLGRFSSMFQLALGTAALCSSFLAGRGLQFIFMAGVVPQIAATIVSLFLVEPRLHEAAAHHGMQHLKKSLLQIWHNPPLRWLMVGEAISYGAGEAAFNFRNVFINQLWPLWALGIYRAINNAGGFLGYWFSGRLIDHLKASRVLVIAQTYWALTSGIAIFMANKISPVIFMTGATFYGPYKVAVDKLMQDEFSDRERATMGSVSSFVGSVFYTVMAFGIGAISDLYGAAAGLGFGVVISAFALPAFMKAFHHYYEKSAT